MIPAKQFFIKYFVFKSKKRGIYLDYAAATPLNKEVLDAMKPYFFDAYANAGSLYKDGVFARKAVNDARASISHFFGTNPDTIHFTSGGTESNNLAILGLARKHASHGKHIISAKTEHSSVLSVLNHLETEGFEVTYLDVTEEGTIDIKDVSSAIRPDTILVTLLHANNEIGTVHPIQEIGKIILKSRKNNNTSYPYFHTDACQSIQYLDTKVESLHVDLLSANAGKIGGPKGIGLLYKKRTVDIEPIMFGGDQEFGLRPGTENVAGIVGFAKAVDLISKSSTDNLSERQEKLISELKNLEDIVVNGPKHNRLVNTVNVSCLGVDAEAAILYLDAEGFSVSSGSACNTDSDEPSHVLAACGLDAERISSALRISFDKSTTESDLEKFVETLDNIIKRLRKAQSDVSNHS
jgi:cysteine desulfurase